MRKNLYHHFSSLASTNTLAVKMAEQGAEHGTVIHADRQTGGKGRGGRQFESPPGGLYFSVILRPELDLAVFPLLTLGAGTCLCTTLREIASVPVLVKWPNDLYLHERKLGGILTESGPIRRGRVDFVVIGAGVNVSTASGQFSRELRQKSISLADVAVCCPSIEDLLPLLVNGVYRAAQRLEEEKEQLLTEWRAVDYLHDRELRYVRHEDENEEEIAATGIGLAEDGQYIILDSCGTEHRV
ncbi:MAG: biotin--[acetyl-CoA-carboxylase] ligase, partial [Candidatus Electrothrix sp. AUS1_2]|nr:biotin--[acetyl-CoA-carboxylase] ligase [Candidatus Electrothrix sp. AUS1_2]